jgi:hypothetical protein
LLPLLAATESVVNGEGPRGCPLAADVSARLDTLLGEASTSSDSLVIDSPGGALRLRLLSSEGSLREQRTLDIRGSCQELADAVASVAVAWQTRLLPGQVSLLLRPAPPSGPALSISATLEDRSARHRPAAVAREVSVGIHESAGARHRAAGLSLGGMFGPILDERFGLATTVGIDAPRSEMVETKKFTWVRLFLTVAPVWRFDVGSVAVHAYAGTGTALTATTSESLHHARAYQWRGPLVMAGARVSYPRSGVTPWLGIGISAETQRHLPSPTRHVSLAPERWLGQLSVGASFGTAALLE